MSHFWNEIFYKWQGNKPGLSKGIIVGSDVAQEWMLPWWWHHFSAHNSFPVTFVDFGLSKQGREWCRAHGTLLPLEGPSSFVAGIHDVDPSLAALWEAVYSPHFWPVREAWFKKPLALLQSPYSHTVWIDLDCEVRGPLDFLFNLPEEMALSREPLIIQERYQNKGLLLPQETYYNSGVISYKHQAEGIIEWAKRALFDNHQFIGDQNLLSRILFEEKVSFYELPSIYNWNRFILGENPQALIYHWLANWGKMQIRAQLAKLPHLSSL